MQQTFVHLFDSQRASYGAYMDLYVVKCLYSFDKS